MVKLIENFHQHWYKNISSEKQDEIGMEIVNWLQGQPWWRIHGGRNHFFGAQLDLVVQFFPKS
jgi:hypothetical protein